MDIGPGTRVFITGAGRGIGRALAEDLAGRGATVGLAARSEGELQELAASLPGEHHACPCDVSDDAAVKQAIDGFVDAAGGLDVVVANAGITHYEFFAEQSLDHVRQMTDINWYGTLYTVHHALPHLLGAGRGHIVIVSSGAAMRSFPQAAVYGATKAAQRMFAEALRHELGGTGVSVTTIFPGEIATSLHDHEKATMPAWYRGGPDAAPASEMAKRIVEGVEKDARSVVYPPLVRALGVVHNLSPEASDLMLRKMRGRSAAPRQG